MLSEQHRFDDNVQAFLNKKTFYLAINAYVAGAAKSKLTQKRGGQAEWMYECTDIDPFIGFLCELEVSREKPINAPISVHPYIRSVEVSWCIEHRQQFPIINLVRSRHKTFLASLSTQRCIALRS